MDASDSLDPASGESAGIDFSKLLWIRCGSDPLCSSVPSVVKAFYHRGHREAQRTTRKGQGRDEAKLEQVLKTTDLILHSGGFGLVALDLAGIPETFVRRIPLASWFRFQRAVEYTKTGLLVVSEFPCAQTCAALVMKLGNKPLAVSRQPSGKPSHAQILEGMQVEVEVVRSGLERKPAQSATAVFKTQAVRVG